jgi:ABC-type sugar transport system ATPase subunit
MPIIEVHNLSYSYPGSDIKCLDNISFIVKRGEFIVLTGPSGCG